MTKLEGTLTREQRIEIAKDVIALCKSKQRKIVITQGTFFSADYAAQLKLIRAGGQLTRKRLPKCHVCARGALFIASVDRHDQCNLGDLRDASINAEVQRRSSHEWGAEQVALIEAAFEGWSFESFSLPRDPQERLMAIMENIVANNGEYKP